MSWLKAREAVEAGYQLADAFALEQPRVAPRDFLARAAHELKDRKLGFYKRVRFANAFKWRLLEKGVEPQTAQAVTHTILMQALVPATHTHHLIDPIPAPQIDRGKHYAQRRALADEALANGDCAEAVSLYKECLDAKPRDAAVLNNLGVAFSRLGLYEAAEDKFRAAIRRQPNHVESHANLGATLLAQGRFQDAQGSLRRALTLKSTDHAVRCNLGLALVEVSRPDDARVEFEKVLHVSPRHPDALHGMGMLARSQGRFEDAENLFRRALVANPRLSRAWAALAGVRKMTSADSLWLRRAEQAACDLKSCPHEEAEIRFAIGKYFDDLGRYSEAFASYQRANELLRKIAPAYDHQADARFVDSLLKAYSAPGIRQSAAEGSDSDVPVFVVGMPRSGTSLIEQILASHPAVGGAGELAFWNDIVRKRKVGTQQGPLPEQERRQIAEDYLRTLRAQCRGSRLIVDKTPCNSAYLGLIHTVFPRARIIHVRRDPLDTALSCYFQNFNLTLNWSLDLTDIARFQQQHERLMRHWKAALPEDILLEVPYEQLVAEPETWTRAMLRFLRLDWNERCLRFHSTERAVVTSSYWQVRQPLYRDSIGRWRNYSRHIGPLRELMSV